MYLYFLYILYQIFFKKSSKKRIKVILKSWSNIQHGISDMVRPRRFELRTSRLSVERSDQLS